MAFEEALHGLRSSPMLWQCQLEKTLKDIGFHPGLHDPAVFLHKERMTIVTHVDDFLVAGPKERIRQVPTMVETRTCIRRWTELH